MPGSPPPPLWAAESDEENELMEAARCPNRQCRIVWTHFVGRPDYMAKRGLKEAAAYVREHYGPHQPYQCPECGTWSVLRSEKIGFWERLTSGAVPLRHLVPAPVAEASADGPRKQQPPQEAHHHEEEAEQ